MTRKSNDQYQAEFATRCGEVLAEINAKPRPEREALLLAATTYRSGNDSCNSVYMGGMAHHSLRLALRDPYPNKMSYAELIPTVSDKCLEAGIKAAIHTIEYMLRNPRDICPRCGSVVKASPDQFEAEFNAWWNSTHDFDFVKDAGLYETHIYMSWMAGRKSHITIKEPTNAA